MSSSPTSPHAALAWSFAALTDVGRIRSNNEDAIAIDAELGLTLLADGMGGYNGGEVAAHMAIECLRAAWKRRRAQQGWFAAIGHEPLHAALQNAIDEANQAILDASARDPLLQGMGTTLVLAVFDHQYVTVGHIGDSRCYRLRGDALELLTRDHSLLQEQLDAGMITPAEAAASPHRNLVTRALGVEPQVTLEVNAHPVQPDDLYLLCSDGLSEMVSHEQLFTILMQNKAIAQKASLLVAVANENGGRDNISVILAQAADKATSRAVIASAE